MNYHLVFCLDTMVRKSRTQVGHSFKIYIYTALVQYMCIIDFKSIEFQFIAIQYHSVEINEKFINFKILTVILMLRVH